MTTENNNRELDAEVAEKVMGWKKGDKWQTPVMDLRGDERRSLDHLRRRNWYRPDGAKSFFDAIPHYTTDPSADYEVLKHVRDNWRGDLWTLFRQELASILIAREQAAEDETESIITNCAVLYKPGDYSRAALEALRVKDSDDA